MARILCVCLLFIYSLTVTSAGFRKDSTFVTLERRQSQQKYSFSQGDRALKVDARCAFCEYFVKKLVVILRDEVTNLNTTLYGFCMKQLKFEYICSMLTKMIDDELLALISGKISPHSACQTMHFCLKGDNHNPVIITDKGFSKSKPICSFCKEFIKATDQYLHDIWDSNQFELDHLCSFIPYPLDSQCLKLVREDVGIQFIRNANLKLEPETFCEMNLKLC